LLLWHRRIAGHAGAKGDSSPWRCQRCPNTERRPLTRPEQQKSGHDRLDLFDASKALPSSTAFENQPDKGQILGFDFYRAPLNAKQPMQTFEEIMQADIAQKGQVMATQRQLLERRYNLTPPELGWPAWAAALSSWYHEPAGHVQPADSRLEAQPALRGGFYRVRVSHRVF
jgi:hypothetical protein